MVTGNSILSGVQFNGSLLRTDKQEMSVNLAYRTAIRASIIVYTAIIESDLGVAATFG